MQRETATSQYGNHMPHETLAFYRDVLKTLNDNDLPYLIGGAYALNFYTGIARNTKDFDIFIAREDYEDISEALADAGYITELAFPHWLAKVRTNGDLIDLVFSSGNGVAQVDDAWFEHSVEADILDIPTQICPAEETLWSKAFIMERERYDGADVAHLILAQGHHMDWHRLLMRFNPHWRLLLSHLILFEFIYPTHRDAVPSWVMNSLLDRMKNEADPVSPATEVCGGTLLSREQYLSDIEEWGYQDARVAPLGHMSESDTAKWTEAIQRKN